MLDKALRFMAVLSVALFALGAAAKAAAGNADAAYAYVCAAAWAVIYLTMTGGEQT